MNPRTTGLLALVALVLGAFVYFYEIEGEKGREAGLESAKLLFPDVEPEAVEAVELTTNDGVPARFERRDGVWWIVSPVEGAGDAVALDAIASALAQLARAGSVKAAPGDLAQFGLGDEAQVVRFDAKGTGHTLRIGKATPVGGNVYVATEAGSEVAYVESFRVNAWKRSLGDLRERRILALEADAVERLVISWPEADGAFELELARDAERRWQIQEPIAARADQATVNELLSNLAYLQASGFVDERTPAVEEALREVAISFRWSNVGGGEEGNEEGDERREEKSGETSKEQGALRVAGLLDGARVVESEGGTLHLIAAERLDDFERRLAAYRDKQLSQLDLATLERIELEFAVDGAENAQMSPVATPDEAGARRVVLGQKEGTWSSEGRDLDPEALAGLASDLASLRASDLVADEMGEAELVSVGLAPPTLRIRLISGSGDASEITALELELGRLDPERGLFARRIPETAVYVLPAALADSLPLSLADFEARLAKKVPEPVSDSASDLEEGTALDLLEQ